MKNMICTLVTALLVASCVQENKKQTVTLYVDVSGIKDIKTVGIRGNDKPFSWDNNIEMEVVKKDSLYKKTFEINTGRLCTEIKFTVNGDFELKDKENRKIYFSDSKTTIFRAKFDVVK